MKSGFFQRSKTLLGKRCLGHVCNRKKRAFRIPAGQSDGCQAGRQYSIRLYYNPGNLNIYTTLAAYGDYETAFSEYVSFLAAIAADRPVYDFSGLIFQTRKEEPDMEEELDLEPD